MDKRFLSDEEIITASRSFVCIRLATYEDAKEAVYLKSFFKGRTGNLENTVFVMIAPDGKKALTRSGRSPMMVYGDGETGIALMVADMKRLAKLYPGNASKSGGDSALPPVPYAEDFRVGLNIAACDNGQIVVLVSDNAQTKKKLELAARKLAWSDDFIGRFAYAVTSRAADTKMFGQDKVVPGLYVVQPDPFGVKGKVVAKAGAGDSDEVMRKALKAAMSKHEVYIKDQRDHVRTGGRAGVEWKTEIPITDSKSLRAKAEHDRQR
jgi:hypothetical protein